MRLLSRSSGEDGHRILRSHTDREMTRIKEERYRYRHSMLNSCVLDEKISKNPFPYSKFFLSVFRLSQAFSRCSDADFLRPAVSMEISRHGPD